jgi:hypothetical protein
LRETGAERETRVIEKGMALLADIGVKTSGGGHKMLETQSTSPTLHGGLVDHRGLILTPMLLADAHPQFP